jgi:hypothetical protein
MKFKRLCLIVLLPLVTSLIQGCEDPVPAGRIKVKNDSQDSQYNKINVSGGGVYETLKPGEFVILPKGTRNFSISRKYKDYTRHYSVECPPIKDGILVKMIDVHVNRIAGGCKTTEATKG